MRRRLSFVYDGRTRLVEPYCYGLNRRGQGILRAVQVGDESHTVSIASGKLWLLAKIQQLSCSDQTFVADDPKYNPHDSAMTEIRCRVEITPA